MATSSPSHTTRARSRCPGIPVRIAEGADGQDLLGASLSLAQTQIAGQLAAGTFYSSYSEQPFALARRQLLTEMVAAIAQNARRTATKRRAVRASIVLVGVGLAGSTIALSLL